jgi:hypothetical protein
MTVLRNQVGYAAQLENDTAAIHVPDFPCRVFSIETISCIVSTGLPHATQALGIHRERSGLRHRGRKLR